MCTLGVQHRIAPRVLKLPAFLYLGPAFSAETAAVSAEDLDGLKHHDVWGLHPFLVLAHAGFVVQLRRGDGREEGGVRRGYGDAVRCI